METLTENGGLTLATSMDPITDFFFRLGASRTRPDDEILKDFITAWSDEPNRLYALKALFYARDVRGGQGERRLFRLCLKWLAQNHPEVVIANISLVPEYGRWDDLLSLMDPDSREYTNLDQAIIKQILVGIIANNKLLFKWLPRERSSQKKLALRLMYLLGLKPKEYRKLLATNTSVVETKMCSDKWTEITYPHVPSRAMACYHKAFSSHDPRGFMEYKASLLKGETKVNVATLYPHEIISRVLYTDPVLAEAQWKALPDYMGDTHRNILPVCDISGSMTGLPMSVSSALGIYLAERNKGAFANHFMTFSSQPKLQKLDKLTLAEKVSQCYIGAGYDTNIEAVFTSLLKAAKSCKATEQDMPEIILILSDMEFNYINSSNGTKIRTFDAITKSYETAGYKVPRVVFWNLAAHSSTNVPVRYTEDSVALVSGFSPSIMKAILSAENFTPLGVMLEALDSLRYEPIRLE